MNIVTRFLWFVSCLGFLAILFGTYGEMNEEIFLLDRTGSERLSRHTYFYLSVGILFVVNLLFVILFRLLSAMPAAFFLVPQRAFWFSSSQHRRELLDILRSWLLALAAVLNYFMMIVLLQVGVNNFVVTSLPVTVGVLVVVGVVLMVLTVVALPGRLAVPKLHLLASRTD